MARIFKGVSIVIHAIVIGIVSYVQIFDPGLLPSPHSALTFEPVVLAKQIPAAPPPRPAAQPTAVAPGLAPIEMPAAITQETGREPEVFSRGDVPGIPGGIDTIADQFGVGVAPPAPPPLRQQPAQNTQPLPIGGNIKRPIKIANVDPIYPELARASRKEGIVILEVVIATDGAVESVRVLRGVPLLDQAAITAVRQWRFEPARLNGQVVPVVMTVTVSFQLTK